MKDPRFHPKGIALRACVVALVALSAVAFAVDSAGANPFETLPPGHWAYDALEGLVSIDLGRAYVRQRLSVGDPLTYFDLALWVGDALDAMREVANAEAGWEGTYATLDEIIQAYNAAQGREVLGGDRSELFRSLVELSATHLEVLGYTLPSDMRQGGAGRTSFQGIASLLEDFRLRGEGRIRYRDVSTNAPGVLPGGGGLGPNLEQSYSLRMSGTVTDAVRIGAELSGEGNMWGGNSELFSLSGGAVDIGISHSAIARVGEVSGQGLSEMVLGEAGRLSGLQAGVNVGQIGSRLLVATVGSDVAQGGDGMLTAWDGAVQVNESLSLGASVASLSAEGGGDAEEKNGSTIFRIGGTYTISPNLTVAGEMARSRMGAGGAVRVGAVLHPGPQLSLGAFLYTADGGYRPLLSGAQSEDEVSRFDLSAEVGRWILSLRRQNVIRTDGESEEGARVTTLSAQYPFGENAVARATHERDDSGGGENPDASKTAFDIEVRLENGKVSLGYVLEDGKGGGSGAVRTTKASVEHAVGPVGTAQAGFSIVDQSGGSETSSNLGLKYELGNASVSLQYEIFTKTGDVRGNVTTAEVAIRF